ncbi:hypothetical protein PTRA_a1589 [Pseudoalteromonas translucida KMM 520]|uniref:Phage tail fibre protein N-terminal domain-containing protein n=1 Tax=Pseudoalteromonas translucida KMM 520 TaxID=1315283 RepID=A0A0U2WYR4_9GAMM|nr:phage tail protein [Pseudoalteromonas translucida]ALS32777.1 hypothetical protein PTRA_a1589 [Pseudoalteromonas translucida KMM 520]
MAQVITIAGEKLFATKAQANQQLDIDTFIFANVTGQDPAAEIDRNEGIPTSSIVHQQNVQQTGRINDNVVVYSTVLDSVTGPFEFNWVGLYSSVNQTLVAISHVPTVAKTITAPGSAGNTLNRNFGIEYSGIADLAGISVSPETWQLDFSARLSGMDELTRQLASDMNGKDWFIDDGFKVVPRSTANTFSVTPGVGYVSGLRVELKQEHTLTLQSYPQFVYVDAYFDGNASSTWTPQVAFTVSNTEMDDYIDTNGVHHYVLKLAKITTSDRVENLRNINGLKEQIELHKNNKDAAHNEIYTRKFKTTAMMQNADKGSIKLGDLIKVDDTNAVYLVSEKKIVDGFVDLELLNDNFSLLLQYDEVLKTNKCGAILDGLADPTPAIQAALNKKPTELHLSKGDYSKLQRLYIPEEVSEITASLDAFNLNKDLINKRFRRKGVPQNHGWTEVANALSPTSSKLIFVREDALTRFYVYQPSNLPTNRFVYRYDRGEEQFDGPLFNRPYLQRQINHSEITPRINLGINDAHKVGDWIQSGIYEYSDVSGDYIEWKFTGTAARISWLRNTNAGSAIITIDGKPANLVSDINMYGDAGSQSTEVADGLFYGEHTIRVTVTNGKNPNSTGFRCYINANAGLRFNAALPDKIYRGNTTDYPELVASKSKDYRVSDSATTYALAFRLASNVGASTPFIGSVHGYENVDSFQLFIDGVEQEDWMDGNGGYSRLRSGYMIQLKHKSQLFHPDDEGAFANITLTETYTAEGYNQSYSIEWLKDIFSANGYTQMWTASGGIAGGVSGALNGWCNNVSFSSGENYYLDGEQGVVGNNLANQVLFWGTPYNISNPLRDELSGDVAMLVTFPNLTESMQGFNVAKTSKRDGVWVNDMARHKKMYMQTFRAGARQAGDITRGKMHVKLIYAPNNGCYDAFSTN